MSEIKIEAEILNDIAKYLKTRETFDVCDKNWLWRCKVMILWISCREKTDDILKVIDMSAMSDTFDVCDYEISSRDLHNAIKLARETKKI